MHRQLLLIFTSHATIIKNCVFAAVCGEVDNIKFRPAEIEQKKGCDSEMQPTVALEWSRDARQVNPHLTKSNYHRLHISVQSRGFRALLDSAAGIATRAAAV